MSTFRVGSSSALQDGWGTVPCSLGQNGLGTAAAACSLPQGEMGAAASSLDVLGAAASSLPPPVDTATGNAAAAAGRNCSSGTIMDSGVQTVPLNMEKLDFQTLSQVIGFSI